MSSSAYDLTPGEQDNHGRSPAARSHSRQKQQEQAPAARTSPDQLCDSYKMSAVNKLVSELARKQRECRKAKLHVVVRLKGTA